MAEGFHTSCNPDTQISTRIPTTLASHPNTMSLNYIEDEDIHPMDRPPLPSWRESHSIDPKLTVTPDRSSRPNYQASNFRDEHIPPLINVEDLKNPSKLKQKQRVRFHVNDGQSSGSDSSREGTPQPGVERPPFKYTPNKEYYPTMYTGKPYKNSVYDQDLDVTQTDDDYLNSISRTTSKNYVSYPMEQSLTEKTFKYLTIRESESAKYEPRKFVGIDPPHAKKCHAVKNVVVTREFENKSASTGGYQFPFIDHTISNEPEHILARPEYNTTLKISEELKDLKSAKPKVAKTLKQKLQSEETITDISEKASVKVNRRSKDHFSGLVGVDPDIKQLPLEVEREPLVVRPKTKSGKKGGSAKGGTSKESTAGRKPEPEPPDVLEFYTEDREKEIVITTLSKGIKFPKPKLLKADADGLFDFYRHHMAWEAQADKYEDCY